MTEPARSVNGRSPPLTALVDKVHALELEALKDRGDLERHEDVCATRYERIDSALSGLTTAIEKVVAKVDTIAETQATLAGFTKGVDAAHRPRWWVAPAVSVGCVLLAAMFAFVGWLGAHAIDDIVGHPGAAAAHAR